MSGWEPREFTEYKYDGDRLVSSVTYREPEWRPDDVALALAAEAVEGMPMSHGVPLSEAMDPANQFAFKAPSKPSTDWAAAAVGAAQDLYYKGPGKGRPRHGHLWGNVERRQSS